MWYQFFKHFLSAGTTIIMIQASRCILLSHPYRAPHKKKKQDRVPVDFSIKTSCSCSFPKLKSILPIQPILSAVCIPYSTLNNWSYMLSFSSWKSILTSRSRFIFSRELLMEPKVWSLSRSLFVSFLLASSIPENLNTN